MGKVTESLQKLVEIIDNPNDPVRHCHLKLGMTLFWDISEWCKVYHNSMEWRKAYTCGFVINFDEDTLIIRMLNGTRDIRVLKLDEHAFYREPEHIPFKKPEGSGD